VYPILIFVGYLDVALLYFSRLDTCSIYVTFFCILESDNYHSVKLEAPRFMDVNLVHLGERVLTSVQSYDHLGCVFR